MDQIHIKTKIFQKLKNIKEQQHNLRDTNNKLNRKNHHLPNRHSQPSTIQQEQHQTKTQVNKINHHLQFKKKKKKKIKQQPMIVIHHELHCRSPTLYNAQKPTNRDSH